MSGKIRKKKAGSLKSHKISTLHAKGRNPSVSMHTKDARVLEKTGGKSSRVLGNMGTSRFFVENNRFQMGTSLNPGVKQFDLKDLGAGQAKCGTWYVPAKGRTDSALTDLMGDFYTGGRYTGVKVGGETYTMRSERTVNQKGQAKTVSYLSPIDV